MLETRVTLAVAVIAAQLGGDLDQLGPVRAARWSLAERTRRGLR